MFAIAMGLVFGLGACKPKQSAYKAAYDTATEKKVEAEPQEEAAPAPRPRQESSANATRERVRVIDGGELRNFSVVIGSFGVKANAEGLKARMAAEGFRVVLVQNERDMYRVIVASFDEKFDAANERDRVKAKYAPDFQDAWLLEKQ